jgi:mono/diheme cytochrome c family protein
MPKTFLAGRYHVVLTYVTGLAIAALIGCTREPSHVASASLAQGQIARGAYLTAVFCCQECHTVRQTDDVHLEGNLLFAGGVPLPGRDGSVVHTANVTIASQYPEQVLGGIIRGRLVYKFGMPTDLYNGMAADDMRDIIAYLKTLRPILRPPPDNHLAPRFVLPPPNPPVPIPAHEPPAGTLERGEYLSRMFLCRDCHSPRDSTGAYAQGHLFEGGGYQVRLPDGHVLSAPNLTPDRETGLGAWSDAEIVRAIRTGVERSGRPLNPVMPYAVAFHTMTNQDAIDLVRFLRSLRPVTRS